MQPGRNTKLDESTRDTIVASLEQGLNLKMAASIARISYFTLLAWRKRGRESLAIADDVGLEPEIELREIPYIDLYLSTEEALANAASTMVGAIREQAGGDWRAANQALKITGMVKDSPKRSKTTIATASGKEGGSDLLTVLTSIFSDNGGDSTDDTE